MLQKQNTVCLIAAHVDFLKGVVENVLKKNKSDSV